MLKYSRSDLIKLAQHKLIIDQDVAFDEENINTYSRIKKVNEIHLTAQGLYYPSKLQLILNMHVVGSITTSCDITLEDVVLPIDIQEDVIFSFDQNETDISIVKAENDCIDLIPSIYNLIVLDMPIKVVKKGIVEYPEGDGWKIVNEETYQKESEHKVNPELLKLKEYKPQDE